MNVDVEYKDKAGNIISLTQGMSRLAFVKHLAVAGQGYMPSPEKVLRSIGMFFHYSYYLQRQAFNNHHFSEPPPQLSDPTEKGQFSNVAGRAIADFLSKRIDKSIFTVNYEAAMRTRNPPLPLSVNKKPVERPDLLAFSQNSMFAIEAKGFSGSARNMVDHKNQSKTGGIPVNYTIASVSYNLYSKIKCKYHDPVVSSVDYDFELFQNLTKDYYSGLAGFLDEKLFKRFETEIQGERFYEIDVSEFVINESIYRKTLRSQLQLARGFGNHFPRLILPVRIFDFAINGLPHNIKPFDCDLDSREESLYIDNDRIGFHYGKNKKSKK